MGRGEGRSHKRYCGAKYSANDLTCVVTMQFGHNVEICETYMVQALMEGYCMNYLRDWPVSGDNPKARI